MEKLRYWIGNILGKQDNYCKHCYLRCKYFEVCKADKLKEALDDN